jgi:hypothetical protein
MATNLAAKVAERVMGEIPTSTTTATVLHPTGEKMKASVWHGKHDVRVDLVDKPQVIEPTDAVVAVPYRSISACTGSEVGQPGGRGRRWLVRRGRAG